MSSRDEARLERLRLQLIEDAMALGFSQQLAHAAVYQVMDETHQGYGGQTARNWLKMHQEARDFQFARALCRRQLRMMQPRKAAV